MRRIALALILVLLSLPLAAQQQKSPQKKKSNFPQLIVKAKWVMVTTYYGSGPSATLSTDMRRSAVDLPPTDPDDLQALGNMEVAIRKWGKYGLAMYPRDADLIFVVRKGRSVDAKVYDQIHIGSGQQPINGVGVRTEAGDDLDTLSIYDAKLGLDGAPLWRGRLDGGLDPPAVKLLQELRKRVEEAEKP